MGPVSLLTQLLTVLTLQTAGGRMVQSQDLLFSSSSLLKLPADNQTYFTLSPSEVMSLEMNADVRIQKIFITISPCIKNLQWAFYQAPVHKEDSALILLQEHLGSDTYTFSVTTVPGSRYILQLISGIDGGGVAVSVRGEEERTVRLRLRARSRRRLLASWEPSPIDPKSTTYCVVVSEWKNYTSLCAAQADAVSKDPEHNKEGMRFEEYSNIVSLPESMDTDSISGSFEENQIDYYIREYRSTSGKKNKASGDPIDPIVACVGTKTHYNVENVDFNKNYYVSVFAVGRDRASGSLLAVSNMDSKSVIEKILKDSLPFTTVISEKTAFYFKTYVGIESGIWIILKTCGGAADLEVLVRGKRLILDKNIDPYTKIFIPTPRNGRGAWDTLRTIEWNEEKRLRYVIKVTPSRLTSEGNIGIEITASTTRWGANMPELQGEGKVVRELRPLRSCSTVDIAFLPAVHNATDVIRYCISAREYEVDNAYCLWRDADEGLHCIEHMQRPPARVLIERVTGLQSGKKYVVQLTAASKGSPVPYNFLYVDTNPICKNKLRNQ